MNLSEISEKAYVYPARVVGCLLVILWLCFGKSETMLCTDGVRLATIESLVEYGTFEISDSIFIQTCDKFRVPAQGEGGKYYSDKPPLLSVLGAGAYFILKSVGIDLRKNMGFSYRYLDFFLVILPVFLILYFSHLYLKANHVPLEHRFWIYLASVCGTLVLPYAMVIQNHVAAAALLVGAYLFFENPMKEKTAKALGWSGLLFGLSISVDLNAIFFAAAFSALCLWRFGKKDRLGVFLFALGVFIPSFATLCFFRYYSGEWRPFVSQVEKFLYQGSILPRVNFMGGYDPNPLTWKAYALYFWHGLLGYKGLFSHSIALLLGFWGIVICLKKEEKTFLDALAILLSTIVLFIFLAVSVPITYGGSNFAFRYMTIWMPLVILFAYRLFQKEGVKPLFKILTVISILTSGAGMAAPWLIHKFDQIDLDNFDFLLVAHDQYNPYLHYEKLLNLNRAEISRLKSDLSTENLIQLSFLYYRLGRPTEALGYLKLLGENDPNGNCYRAVIFSKKGLNLEDLMQRYASRCPADKWKELSEKMGLNVQTEG